MTGDRKYLLPRLSVNRPVTVLMVLVALVVVGLIAADHIPTSLDPEGQEQKRIWVWVPYPNATPEEVEQRLTRPLEEAVAAVRRVKHLNARSRRGSASMRIDFMSHTDMDAAYADVRDRLDRVQPELPDEVERIWMGQWGEGGSKTLMYISVAYENVEDPFSVLDTQVRPILQRIDGVAQVDLWGLEDTEVLIEMDQEKLRSHDVDAYRLVNELRGQSTTLPAGYVHEGGKKLHVRSMGGFDSIDEIKGILADPERALRLRDIATVELKEQDRRRTYRVGRKDALTLAVRHTAGANMVEVSSATRDALEELKRNPQLEGFEFIILADMGQRVLESVDNLKNSGFWGGLFATLVLLFFLRAVRMTLIITLAIPLSILATMIALYLLGWSLNVATMTGLLLSLGLVVDNAIVIVENIYRKRQAGAEPRSASVEGTGEVSLAVTMATLTTAVVFVPLILMSDDEHFAFWMLRVGMPVIAGLLASLVIALVFIPLAAERLAASREPGEFDLLRRLRDLYLQLLRWVLDHRLDTLIVVLLAMASIHIPMEGIKSADAGQRYMPNLDLRFSMPSGQLDEEATEFVLGVEDTLMNHREEYNIETLRTWIWFSSNTCRINVHFVPPKKLGWYEVAFEDLLVKVGLREKAHLDYMEFGVDVRKHIHLNPGYTLRVELEEREDDASLAVNLYGEDTRVLLQLAEEVERRLQSIPGLLGVYTDVNKLSPELLVRLDRNQIRRYGLSLQRISGSITYLLGGAALSEFQTDDGRLLNMRVYLEEGDRRNLNQLRNLTFSTADGKEIPLEALASLHVRPNLGQIRRDNRQTMLSVRATAPQDDAGELFEQVDAVMQGFEMPRGYHWDKGERFARMEEDDQSQRFAIIVSVTFVFLLMGLLFESFLLPLSVIVAVPFAFLGVYWTLYLTGTTYEVMARIGTVILIGVVVNNAIVLVDLTNRLRRQGMSRHQALIEAARHRFRPILMTTFTTVCGLIPMAVGNAKVVGMPYSPLGRTLMGGLLASMVLTLVIVPLCYTFFDDLREWMRLSSGRSPASPQRFES